MLTLMRKMKMRRTMKTMTTDVQKVGPFPTTGRIESIQFRHSGQRKIGGALSILCDTILEEEELVALVVVNRVNRTAFRLMLLLRDHQTTTTTGTERMERIKSLDRAVLLVVLQRHLISNCSLPDWSRWDGSCPAGRPASSRVSVIVRCSPQSPSSWLPLLYFRYSHDRHHTSQTFNFLSLFPFWSSFFFFRHLPVFHLTYNYSIHILKEKTNNNNNKKIN